MLSITQVRERVARVQDRIAAAGQRAGRDPSGVTLVAVTKMQSPETVSSAYAAGLKLFGENRVEEAAPKAAAVAAILGDRPPPAWHMIGHLQSRKAGDVLPWAAMLHSVESLKLASRLSRLVAERAVVGSAPDLPLPVLLEVNISGEASKYGVMPAEALTLARAVAVLPGLRLAGLMTMAPVVTEPAQARPVFAGLRSLRDDLVKRDPSLNLPELSMGMSDDFEVAVEEGATIVRIGRAIFSQE